MAQPRGRKELRNIRDAKSGFLILNRFPCQGTNAPHFKIIIISPGRVPREPLAPNPSVGIGASEEAPLCPALCCLPCRVPTSLGDVWWLRGMPVGRGWLRDLHLGSSFGSKGNKELCLTLHPREQLCSAEIWPTRLCAPVCRDGRHRCSVPRKTPLLAPEAGRRRNKELLKLLPSEPPKHPLQSCRVLRARHGAARVGAGHQGTGTALPPPAKACNGICVGSLPSDG